MDREKNALVRWKRTIVNGPLSERPESMKSASKTLNEIRSDACNVILVTFTVLATVATTISILRGINIGFKPVMFLHVGMTLLLGYLTVRRHHLSLNVRAAFVTAVPFLAVIGGFLTYGRGNGTLMFYVTGCVLAGCFFDRRGALAALALSLGSLAVLYFGYRAGIVDMPVNIAIFEMTGISWFALGLAVLMAAAVPLIGVSALLESLETERARANEAARARSDFLANISHELRTPMAHIIGLAEVLKGTGLDDNQRGVIANMTLSGHNLLTMLNGLLDYTKFEAGKIALEKRPFRLADEIRNICRPFETKAEQKGLHFELELADKLPDDVIGDSDQLRQALSNLIDNAVKFTSVGGVLVRVEATSRDDGTFLLICKVIDTGIGIPSEYDMRIFEPFIQVDMTTSRKYGGAGLGLAICRGIAMAMGGDVSVSSEFGAGSSFMLRIPLERGVAPADVAPSLYSASHGYSVLSSVIQISRPLRLLVVDDDASMRTVADIILKERGHDVTLVENGSAAVAEASTGSYDCIIMDMHMPIMNGPDAMRALRKIEAIGNERRRIPIIALSADVLPEHVRGFKDAGADAFIPKPVVWHVLEATMQALVADVLAAEKKAALQS